MRRVSARLADLPTPRLPDFALQPCHGVGKAVEAAELHQGGHHVAAATAAVAVEESFVLVDAAQFDAGEALDDGDEVGARFQPLEVGPAGAAGVVARRRRPVGPGRGEGVVAQPLPPFKLFPRLRQSEAEQDAAVVGDFGRQPAGFFRRVDLAEIPQAAFDILQNRRRSQHPVAVHPVEPPRRRLPCPGHGTPPRPAGQPIANAFFFRAST